MNDPAQIEAPVRVRARVRGVVQGVGFRPFVYNLARRYGLSGWVMNDAEGVLLEVEGAATDAFLRELREAPPPLSRITAIDTTVEPTSDEVHEAFVIRPSGRGHAATAVPADVGPCDACIAELFDPTDRRYLYPFLNCTHCGPRFTITARVPYDRPNTSMAGFPLCDACAREYADPGDRRFHAQPTACPECGPKLSHQMSEVVRAIDAGAIVALKGVGGFHLLCDATRADVVERLRLRKSREAKPFAVMVSNLASAARHARLRPSERALLESMERPIVLARRNVQTSAIVDSVSAGLPTVGLVLPPSPLHYVLFHEALGRPEGTDWLSAPNDRVFVLTSANPGGAPLVVDDAEARSRLEGIADLIVGHDRPIVVRTDDSVVRVVAGAPRVIRRARGYVPAAFPMTSDGACVLALGAHLKATVCVTRGREAFLSQHVGDLDDAETRRFHREVTDHLLATLEVTPELVAHDLHPDLYTTSVAAELGVPTLPVQHHHAHIGAVLAEHGRDEAVLGVALDGYGYGADGGAWGGELLRVEGAACERLGKLTELVLIGGDRAAREPRRMAFAALSKLGRLDEAPRLGLTDAEINAYAHMATAGINSPPTSSCGRLFDAAAGLLGVRMRNRYEGEAAMALEGLVASPRVLVGGFELAGDDLDFQRLLGALPDLSARDGAELFHGTVAVGLAVWIERAAERLGLSTVVLGGGCFQNRVLTKALLQRLAGSGLEVLLPEHAPANDGGLSLGQAWVAGRALESGTASTERS